MSTFTMSALTAEEIRSIANKAVADVTRQKITTTKVTRSASMKIVKTSGNKRRIAKAKGSAVVTQSGSNMSGTQKSLAGSGLSQSAGRGFFKDAFNKARKG